MKNTPEKSLRDKYFANEIFKIGDIVEDTTTSESMKIIDRGSNYVTVATSTGIVKKWLNEVKEETKVEKEIILEEKPNDFTILESGQIKLFGYETRNFNTDLSEFILEQFSEFDDLYSKHQIIKCLDLALQENNVDKAFSLAERVDEFYTKHKIESPFIVEAIKSEIERRRIVDVLAAIADVKVTGSMYQVVSDSIKALKSKYKLRTQWEIILPFFKLTQDYGLTGIMQKLPFDLSHVKEEVDEDFIILQTLEENVDLLVDDLDIDDITEAFQDEEECDELLSEVLSIETRNKLSRKLTQHAPVISIKRERALSRAASTSTLMSRARKLAETILKRRMFHKPAGDLSRPEKERFESGAFRRRSLVARLAQKLLPKVRMLQTQRLHHSHAPATHTHDIATAKISASVGAA